MTTRTDIPEKTIRKQARQYLIALLLLLILWGLIIGVISIIVVGAINGLS